MGNIIDVRDIFKDYFHYMRKDLKKLPFFITLILPSLVVTFIVFVLLFLNNLINPPTISNSQTEILSQISTVIGNILLICSILIPLLINLLMIVYYGVEKIERNYSDFIKNKCDQQNLDDLASRKAGLDRIKLKYTYLNHVNSTVSMSIIISVIILICCIFYNIVPNFIWLLLISYLFPFTIINLFVIIRRIHLLIRTDLKNNTNLIDEALSSLDS